MERRGFAFLMSRSTSVGHDQRSADLQRRGVLNVPRAVEQLGKSIVAGLDRSKIQSPRVLRSSPDDFGRRSLHHRHAEAGNFSIDFIMFCTYRNVFALQLSTLQTGD